MPQQSTIVTVGETGVEFVAHKKNGGLREISEYSGPYPSGAPAIFLDQAARMGARTEMIGGVGDDGFGRCVMERLATDGVGTRGITVNPDLSTGVAFVSSYDDGPRDFIFHPTNTASDHFTLPAEMPDASATILHVSAASFGNAAMRRMIMTTVQAVDDAGEQANTAGALAVTRRGPMVGNSSPKDIAAYHEKNQSERVA